MCICAVAASRIGSKTNPIPFVGWCWAALLMFPEGLRVEDCFVLVLCKRVCSHVICENSPPKRSHALFFNGLHPQFVYQERDDQTSISPASPSLVGSFAS